MREGSLRLAMAQVNVIVGDLEGNARKIVRVLNRARRLQVDVVAFPELAVTGYPPEDLLFKPQFIQRNLESLRRIQQATQGIVAVVGFVDRDGQGLYNAAAVLSGKRCRGIYRKCLLPNYGVFDEKRYFLPGSEAPVFLIRGVACGVNICEDIWFARGPTRTQALAGARVILNINGSPYYAGKWREREAMLAERARENRVVIAYTNLVGGQDELVFDGHSLLVDRQGKVLARGRQFQEDLVVADVEAPQGAAPTARVISRRSSPRKTARVPARSVAPLRWETEIYEALILGTRDYVEKNRFQAVVIGLSGGVDSSLTAAIAADALGPKRVRGVLMPSQYTSQESVEDARALARNLGIQALTVPIRGPFRAYLKALSKPFQDREPDVTEENLQARIRGNYLMALSNKFGWLVLTTGNKSEMSVGYATLYGDMAGGFAVIKDVPKTLVYALCRYRNGLGAVIPQRVLVKPPSAELRPDQRDEDALPPYSVLDPILQAYVEEDRSLQEIVKLGFRPDLVRRVIQMVDRSEYKRRQAPPGIKITPKAFGRDRRMPITHRYVSR